MQIDERVRVQAGADDPDARRHLEELSDEELMRHFQAGVVQAFDILVNRYSERLTHFILKFVKDRHKAKDLVQETFLRVYRNRHGYKPIAKFSTWLYTIAGNLARSEYRKKKRRPTRPLVGRGRHDEEYQLPLEADVHKPNHLALARRKAGVRPRQS